MRWGRNTDYVVIEGAKSEDEGAVWIVKSSLPFTDLPIEFRRRVPQADDEGFKNLKRAVSSWAERNGFQLVDDSEDLDDDGKNSDGDGARAQWGIRLQVAGDSKSPPHVER